MNWNLVRSIYGRSSIKKFHFVQIHIQANSQFWCFILFWCVFFLAHLTQRIGSCTKIPHFVLCRYKICPLQSFLFLIGQYTKRSTHLKVLCQLEQNFTGKMFVRSSTKILHFILFGQKHAWLPHAILVSHWPICKKNLLLWNYCTLPIGTKLWRNGMYKAL